MTDQFTPTTRSVRSSYIHTWDGVAAANAEEASKEFDRWLASIVSAAEQRGAERGWDEAIDYAWDDSSIYQADAARAKSKNPYRADRLEGDGD